MHTYDSFLGDPRNEVIIGLVLLVLAQTAITRLWWSRARGLQRRLEASADAAGDLQRRLEASAEAATDAAIELAVDADTYEAAADAPVVPDDEPAAIAATPPAAVPTGASPTATATATVYLLLVEDDVNVARPYRMLLESRGYTVLHATDGVEGLEAARRERPALLLVDVMMPRMNGISLLQALRED